METPWGVAVNKGGEIVVSDHCISVLNPRGEKLRSFGTYGSRLKQFRSPRGVAVDGEGYILVADCYNHCIQKLTAEGVFLMTVGTGGTNP